MPKALKRQLLSWRARKSITQTGAAKLLGVPLPTYRNWEQGRNIPTGLALSKLTEIFNAK